MKGRRSLLVAFGLGALAVLLVAPWIGHFPVSLDDVLAGARVTGGTTVFWRLRVPRVLLAFLAGSGLSVSGMVFQALFRNALATPFTLGVASGASMGAALAIQWGWVFALPLFSGVSVFAFAGALLTILLVYGVTRIRGGFSSATLLLAGVAISFFLSSVILFLQYLGEVATTVRILRWIMGGLEIIGYDAVINVFPFVIVGCLITLFTTRELNLLTTGDQLATSRGVDVPRVQKTLFVATSLMVGGVVAECGPIGFVGLISPHICRLLVGPDHRYLFPASFLFGGIFLTLCDTVARTVLGTAQLPVGIVTALLGGPFFLWLLIRDTSHRSA